MTNLKIQETPVGQKTEAPLCYHCGLQCESEDIISGGHYFCCDGCRMVYEVLSENNLCTYYSYTHNPGTPQKDRLSYKGRFSVLDNPDIRKRFIRFADGEITRATFYVPTMHCSSCIWLLEHLHKLNPGIVSSVVNFPKRTADIIFRESQITLAQVAELLASVGYEPHISLNDLEENDRKTSGRSKLLKIGIAGFCFGNIMMLSFPEYFSVGNFYDQPALRPLFGLLNLSLSLPVLFYSSREFFVSAFKSIRNRHLNIDAPIALAILITFLRSVYEVTTGTGGGYFDSMTGIVFFMLLGRYVQDKTYDTLSFDRNYKSFFPIGISLLKNGQETQVPIADLKKYDHILVRNTELIPADAVLLSKDTRIDYSFVTGEATPVYKQAGDIIYAGGKITGTAAEFSVIKPVSQSYLTQLWNNTSVASDKQEQKTSYTEFLNTWFSKALLVIAALTAIYWLYADTSRLLNAVTSILIVACPCALLLSSTFSLGNVLSILGRNRCYLKNADVIDKFASADMAVFDKTGTVTQAGTLGLTYSGSSLSEQDKQVIYSLASHSSHPFSRMIAGAYKGVQPIEVLHFSEIPGKGLYGEISGIEVELGSAEYLGISAVRQQTSAVYVAFNGRVKGHFMIHNQVRPGLLKLVQRLSARFPLFLLSGDNEADRKMMSAYFKDDAMMFGQKPDDKLNFVRRSIKEGHKPMMVGDGLNDAGALLNAHVGVVVSDNVNNFSPACDAVIQGDALHRLPDFIDMCKSSRHIINISFAISIIYNIIGLYFAVQGTLQPVIAAILMPASSISIVLFTTLGSRLIARLKYKL